MYGSVSRYIDSNDDVVNGPGGKLVWAPLRCSGVWGISINAFAILYIIIVVFSSFWPTEMHPSVEIMNWSVLGIGGSSCLAVIYYFARARDIYARPIRELHT